MFLKEKSLLVELEAKVKYKSGNACFKVEKGKEGIFTANLLAYDGDYTQSPPEGIILVRGIRYWTGSVEDEILLNELGRFIDSNWLTDDAQ